MAVTPESLTYGDVLFDEAEVSKGIRWLAGCAVEAYHDGPKPLFVVLLRGGMPFASQLMTEISKADPGFHPELDTITVSTYGKGRNAGQPKLVMGIDEEQTKVADRRVVVLDDMIDEGITAAFAANYLKGLGAANVDVAALAIKDRKRHPSFAELPGDHVWCFSVPDLWITGMGMDDERVAHEGNRWLPLIAVAREA